MTPSEERDSLGRTLTQRAQDALALSDNASDPEKQSAARDLLLAVRGVDSPDGSALNGDHGYKPLAPADYFTRMRKIVADGAQIETVASREFHAIQDENEKYTHAKERLPFWKANLSNPAGHLFSAHVVGAPIAEEELPEDLTPEDRALATRERVKYEYERSPQSLMDNGLNAPGPALPDRSGLPASNVGQFADFNPAEQKRLADIKDRVARRRVIAEYEARMKAENVVMQFDAVKGLISEPAQDMIRQALKTNETPGPQWLETFQALPLPEQQIAATVIFDAKHTENDGFLVTAAKGFLESAVQIPRDAARKYFVDAVARQTMTDSEWNKHVQTRALWTQMVAEKPQEFGPVPEAFIGAVVNVPYMLEAMVPYVGIGMVAGQMADEYEQRVASEGGDVTSLDFRTRMLATSVAAAATEKWQGLTAFGTPTAIQTRMIYSGFWKSIYKAGKVIAATAGEATEQTAQEVVQQTLEEGFVAHGLGKDEARAAAEGAVQTIYDAGGMMLVTAGFGTGSKAARLNFDKRLSIDETISARLHAQNVIGKYDNITDKGIREDRAAIGSLRDIWFKSGNQDRAVQAFRDIGMPDLHARSFANMFQAEYTAIMASDKLTPEQKARMIGQNTDARGWLLKAMPDAELTEGPDGGFSFSRTLNGVKTTYNVVYHSGGDFDKNTEEAATSITQALLDATRGAPDGRRVDMTPEQWLALSPEDKQFLVDNYEIRVNGFFTPVSKKHGVTKGSLAVLAGTIHLDRAAHPATLFHEYFHGFTRMLKDAGAWNEADIAKARAEFGPGRIAGEDFNEEAAADAFQGFVAGKVNPPEQSVLRHIWNALAAIMNAVRGKKHAAALAVTARESMFEQTAAGNFTGIPVATIASTEAARQAQTTTRQPQATQGQAPAPATPSDVTVTTMGTPVEPVARYAPGDTVIGSHTDPDGTVKKGSPGTVDEVITNPDGSFSYRVRWENGQQTVKPEAFFFVEPTAPAALLTPADLPAQPLTTRTTGRAPTGSQTPSPAQNAGGVSFTPVQEAAAREEAAKVAAIKGTKGRFESTTPDGSIKVSGYYGVMPLDGPITSDMPGYPAELQGRDRGNVASRIQIQKIARDPQPARLFESPETDGGAPILTHGMHVLSGNGRMLGLREAAKLGNLEEYDRWVREKARELGIEIPAGTEHPVLVRILDSTTDQAQLARISELSNRSRVLARGQAETAEADAKTILAGGLLTLYAPDASGNMFAAGNREFMSGFIRAAHDDSLVDSDGQPTDAAGDRVRRAMLAIIAGRGPDARNVIRALVEESRAVGMSRVVDGAAKAAGELVSLADIKPEYSLLDELALALREFMQFKLDGAVNVREWVGQAGLFGPARPSIIDKLVVQMGERNTAGGIYAMLKDYYERARTLDNKTGDMFGAPPTSKEAVLDLAIKQTAEAAQGGTRYSVSAAAEKRAGKQFRKVIEGEYEAAEKQARARFKEAGSAKPVTYGSHIVVHSPYTPGVREFARRHDVLLQRRTRGEAAIQAETDRLTANPLASDRQRREWARVSYSYSLAESADFTHLLEQADIADVELIPIHSKTFAARQVGNVLFISDPESGQYEIQKALFRTALAGGSPNAASLVERVDAKSQAFTRFSSLLTDIHAALGLPAPDRKTAAQELAAEFFAADGYTAAQLMQPKGATVEIGKAFTDPDAAEGDVIGIMDDWDSGQVSVQQSFRYSVSASQGQPDQIAQAFADWTSKRAYIDNAGNYRVRDMVEVAGVMVPEQGGKGQIAPWNKAVKAAFPDSAAFHQAAQQGQRGAVQQTFRYSVSAQEARDWRVNLNFYTSGTLDKTKMLTVLDRTPAVLARVLKDFHGIDSAGRPIKVSVGTLDKITGLWKYTERRGQNEHAVPLDQLKNLTLTLDDPIAVFMADRNRESQSIVALVEIRDDKTGENSVVSIKYTAHDPSGNEINAITSAYGHEAESVQGWIDRGMLEYANTKKVRSTFSTRRLQLPTDRKGYGPAYLTESDFASDNMGKILDAPGAVNPQNPPAPRNSMQASRGQYSNESKLVADAAARILAGKEAAAAQYDRLASVLNTGKTGQQIVDQGKALAETETGKAATAALSGADPHEAITMLAKAHEMTLLRSAVRRGAQAHASLSEAGRKATDAGDKAILAAVRGEDLQTFTVDTGIDLTKTLLNARPDTFNDRPEAAAAQADQPGEPGPTAEQIAREVTPEELAARTARSSNLVDLVREWWAQERAKRQKRADERAAILERGGTLSDEEAAQEQEDASSMAAIPPALLEASAVNLNSAQEVAHLFRVWVGQWMIDHSAGRITSQNVWTDAESVEKYRRTIVQQLQDMANKLVDATDHALPNIMRTIGDIAPSMTVSQIERMSALVIASIQRNAIRQKQQALTDQLAANIKKKAVDGPEFDPTKRDVKRKVTAEVERIARLLAKIIYYTDRKVAAEMERINAEIEQQTQALANSHNPAANIESDFRYYALTLERMMLERYGGLRYRMPAEIQAAKAEIENWLTVERARIEERWTRIAEEDDANATDLAGGIERDPEQHGRPDKEGWFASLVDSLVATTNHRLLNLVRFAKGEPLVRSRAVIDRLRLLMGEGSEVYTATLDRYRRENTQLIIDASDGHAADYLKHLDEPIPEDMARTLSNQGWIPTTTSKGMTYGQAVQLYASITQSFYADNVIAFNRQEHARILETMLSAADLKLVNGLRRLYAERREELSDVVREITGMPVWSPDPNYMPVQMFLGARGGLITEARAWSPLAAALTPRVKNGRDFDESADVLSMLSRSNENSARAIAFGARGVRIRGIIGRQAVQNAIIRYHGKEQLSKLLEQVNDHLMGIDEHAGGGDVKLVRAASRITSYTALSWNMLSTAKQLGGVVSWATVLEGGFKDMFQGMIDFDRQTMRELMDSDGFRARYGAGMIKEIQEAITDSSGRAGFIKRLYRAGFQPLQVADRMAALAVGTGIYKAKRNALLDQGVDPATAMRIAKTLTFVAIEESQQSARPENQPAILRRYGPLARLFVQFASAPLLQLSHEVQAARQAAAGVEGARAKLARIVFINHILMPLIMQSVTAMVNRLLGDDEDEDFWTELAVQMAVGPFSRLIFLGSAGENTIRTIFRLHRNFSGRSVPAESALRLFDQGIVTTWDFITLDWDKAQEDLVKMIQSTGAPQRHIIKAWKNYSE